MECTKDGAQDKAIAVMVKKGQHSQLALKWAVENLATENQSLILVHVRRESDAFARGGILGNSFEEMAVTCGEDVAQQLEESYKQTLNLQVKEMFRPFVSYCKKKNVNCEEMVVEDNDLVKAISDFVLVNNIDVLVVGTGSRGGILKKLKGPDTATKIAKSVPYFCTVYTVAKGGVVSAKTASTAAQTPTPPKSAQIQEPDIGSRTLSFNSQIEPRISASAGDFMLQPSPVNEFEFRSPLQNYGGSDLDISFISNERHFYDPVSSGSSNMSSDWSLGSFDSLPSTNSPSYGWGSDWYSDASYSPQCAMDEMRRLQLELTQTKKMYEAACQEALNAKMMASKLKPEDFEEDEATTQMVRGSILKLAKLKSVKDEAATKITDISKRIAELRAQQNS